MALDFINQWACLRCRHRNWKTHKACKGCGLQRISELTSGVFYGRGLRNIIWDCVYPEPMSGCWLWTGSVSSGGYARTWVDGRAQNASRVIYRAIVGPIQAALELDHLCRNVNCVNPEHLEPVTHQVNTLRGVGPTARHARKTHCLRGHPYDETNTYRDRKGRRCRACANDARKHRWKELGQ